VRARRDPRLQAVCREARITFLSPRTVSLSVATNRIDALTARRAGPAGPTRLEHIK